jgi:hypothetical protein
MSSKIEYKGIHWKTPKESNAMNQASYTRNFQRIKLYESKTAHIRKKSKRFFFKDSNREIPIK